MYIMLIKPVQRYIKRQVERDIFNAILRQANSNPLEAKVRLNWVSLLSLFQLT